MIVIHHLVYVSVGCLDQLNFSSLFCCRAVIGVLDLLRVMIADLHVLLRSHEDLSITTTRTLLTAYSIEER